MSVANQGIDGRLSASYWSKALSHLLELQRGLWDIDILQHSQVRKFPQPQSKNYIWNRLTFINKDLQLLEWMEEFFHGNYRITSDCPVCTCTLKTLSGYSMLAEIVRNSFNGRGDLSELCSQMCCVAIFNPCQELYLLSEERMISFERTKTNHDKLPRENNTEV